MFAQRLLLTALIAWVGVLAGSRAATAADPQLTEKAMVSLIELQIDDEAIIARV